MRISDWSSDVCSSDLFPARARAGAAQAMMGSSASESAYRVLMGVLESRTGQTLSPSRIWRIEMSLKPVMQRHGIADLDALVASPVTSKRPPPDTEGPP